jgi:hypothetical protein
VAGASAFTSSSLPSVARSTTQVSETKVRYVRSGSTVFHTY